MIEVFGVTPSWTISCTPITAPNTDSTTRRISVAGANAAGCGPSAAADGAADRSVVRLGSAIAALPHRALAAAASGSCIAPALTYHLGRDAGVAQWQSRS